MRNTTTTHLTPETLARLKRRLQLHSVTQREIAARAQVSKFHVCHVLAGRVISGPVIRAAKGLLAEALDAKRIAQAEAVLAGDGRPS